MNLYELVNPSDMTTFKAKDDKVACYCAVILGDGKYGCEKYNDQEQNNIPSLLLFDPDPGAAIEKYLQCSVREFAEKNRVEIVECFKSFAYGSLEDRKTYDDALKAITEINKLKEFKTKHEDRNRSSMNTIVATAWQYAEHYTNQ